MNNDSPAIVRGFFCFGSGAPFNRVRKAQIFTNA